MRGVDSILASRPSFADRALGQLSEWPALKVCQADCGAGMGLAVSTHQIIHLHRSDEAELHLTWPVIERLSTALADSDQVHFSPGSNWIRLRLECDSDVRLLVLLVSVAIQANTRPSHGPRYRPHARCPHWHWSQSAHC
ncbi:MAG TPA: luciferase family protein [Streptosporangiaceae bacterium]|nr:luciferase family protein [Streptosporangiaceae bacterium]